MLTFFSLFFFCFFYLVLALLFISYHTYFFEFGSLGSQTHESQTRWPTSTFACITHCKVNNSRSDVFIKFEHISSLFLVFPLLTLNK